MALKKSKKDAQNTGMAFKEVLRECHHFLVWFCPNTPIWDLGHLPKGEADVDELHELSSPSQGSSAHDLILSHLSHLPCLYNHHPQVFSFKFPGNHYLSLLLPLLFT